MLFFFTIFDKQSEPSSCKRQFVSDLRIWMLENCILRVFYVLIKICICEVPCSSQSRHKGATEPRLRGLRVIDTQRVFMIRKSDPFPGLKPATPLFSCLDSFILLQVKCFSDLLRQQVEEAEGRGEGPSRRGEGRGRARRPIGCRMGVVIAGFRHVASPRLSRHRSQICAWTTTSRKH